MSSSVHGPFEVVARNGRVPVVFGVEAEAGPEDLVGELAAELGEEPRAFVIRDSATLSCQAADFLRSGGVRPGDRVLVMLPRVPQWWIGMLGLIRLGAVPVPATLLLTARDVAYRLESARV